MKTYTIKITPEMAERLLKFNQGNRKLRDRTVNYFATCIKEGTFHLTHQGIAIAGTLQNPIHLFDGQHRLAAIVKTGKAVFLQVSENAHRACFENADNGLPRTISDRTGLPMKVATLCNVIATLCTQSQGQTRKFSVDKIKAIHEEIEPYLHLLTFNGTRGTGLAGFNAAFLLQQYVFGRNHSAEFNSADPKQAEYLLLARPLLFSLRLRMSSAVGRVDSLRHEQSFCLAWGAINAGENKKKNLVRKDAVQRAEQIIKDKWSALWILSNAGISRAPAAPWVVAAEL
jgi:hypothetical protein